jgi:hypothetical protein
LASKLLATSVLLFGFVLWCDVARSQRQPQTFFKTKIGLSESDIQRMKQGHVVTKLLDSPDKKYGVLVFGGVYINASIEPFATSYRDVKTLRQVHLLWPNSIERKDIDAIQIATPALRSPGL